MSRTASQNNRLATIVNNNGWNYIILDEPPNYTGNATRVYLVNIGRANNDNSAAGPGCTTPPNCPMVACFLLFVSSTGGRFNGTSMRVCGPFGETSAGMGICKSANPLNAGFAVGTNNESFADIWRTNGIAVNPEFALLISRSNSLPPNDLSVRVGLIQLF